MNFLLSRMTSSRLRKTTSRYLIVAKSFFENDAHTQSEKLSVLEIIKLYLSEFFVWLLTIQQSISGCKRHNYLQTLIKVIGLDQFQRHKARYHYHPWYSWCIRIVTLNSFFTQKLWKYSKTLPFDSSFKIWTLMNLHLSSNSYKVYDGKQRI